MARWVYSNSNSSARARAIAQTITQSKAFSLAGGGDTLAAIEKYGVEDGISYISTGGGAFLEFIEGKRLPAVAVLEERVVGDRGGDGGADAERPGLPDPGPGEGPPAGHRLPWPHRRPVPRRPRIGNVRAAISAWSVH